MSEEYRFDELRLIPDARKPTEAIGYIDGCAEIDIVHGGYVIGDIWCSNTADHGTGLVLVDRHSPLHAMLSASLQYQFGEDIRDFVNDYLDDDADLIGGTVRAREYA